VSLVSAVGLFFAYMGFRDSAKASYVQLLYTMGKELTEIENHADRQSMPLVSLSKISIGFT
jgi:hypothetical protein